ncbi:MAG TPA: GNAT family N-acetyltransferase [Acidimicrobiales bacterium]|nr:GNAT family N-acetyltransferase [Acidimicrobiales bacterium]
MAQELTSGWEAHVPAGDSLLRAYVLTTVERSEVIARAAGGEVARTDDVALADSGSPVLFDNVATFLRPLTVDRARAAVAAALAFFPPDRPFAVLSAWPIPEAGDLGIQLMGHPPFMFRAAGPPPDGWDAGLELREVRTEDELATFFRTIVEAYPIEGGGTSALAAPAILETGVRFWVGYAGDEPVGTAGVYVAHGQNDVEWISVHDRFRGRGYGAALTWVATRADPSLPATLIASDPGQPVYERMGYIRLTRMSMWFRPVG